MYYPRQEGNKLKLQKLYKLLHFPLMIFFFCHAENFDAGTGERHMKDVFNDIARNSQQRGQDTFLSQVGAQMHEKLIMTKAKQFSDAMAEYYYGKQSNTANLSNSPATSGNIGNDVTHTLPQNKMYIISYHASSCAGKCKYQVGNDCTRWQCMDETHLCSWWQLSMKCGSLQDDVGVSECT
jgi:hypothetical protein